MQYLCLRAPRHDLLSLLADFSQISWRCHSNRKLAQYGRADQEAKQKRAPVLHGKLRILILHVLLSGQASGYSNLPHLLHFACQAEAKNLNFSGAMSQSQAFECITMVRLRFCILLT